VSELKRSAKDMKPLWHLLILLFVVAPCSASSLDRLPKLLDLSLPSYPVEEKQAAHKAIVSVLIVVDEKGHATVERVMTSSTYRFAAAVQGRAATWKFRAGRRDDKPTTIRVEYLVFFDPEKPVEISGPLYE
jgi:hypothetical protein